MNGKRWMLTEKRACEKGFSEESTNYNQAMHVDLNERKHDF
jgi:hypothetical protein